MFEGQSEGEPAAEAAADLRLRCLGGRQPKDCRRHLPRRGPAQSAGPVEGPRPLSNCSEGRGACEDPAGQRPDFQTDAGQTEGILAAQGALAAGGPLPEHPELRAEREVPGRGGNHKSMSISGCWAIIK